MHWRRLFITAICSARYDFLLKAVLAAVFLLATWLTLDYYRHDAPITGAELRAWLTTMGLAGITAAAAFSAWDDWRLFH